MFRYAGAFALSLALPASLQAQEVDEVLQQTDLAEASIKGTLMAQIQRATALAQRQYAGMVAEAVTENYRGAVALPAQGEDQWLALIVGERGEELVALAEYEIDAGRIVSETIHTLAEAPALDGTASAMAQALGFAPRAVLAAGFRDFCTSGEEDILNLVTIVLPPDEDGRFDAWVLNGPIEENTIPLGKHFRVGFDEFGLDGEPEQVTETCEVVTWTDAAIVDAIYPVEFPGHAAPSAVHVFLSTLMPMQLGIATDAGFHPIANGVVGSAAPLPTQ
ncbi:MAG: hypothetical protein WBA68_05210 [Alteraurantiacibacter sp.]